MPRFIVIGVGRETGRRRKRVVDAKDDTKVRALAEADGTVVGSIERLPDDPPTEPQLAYAKNLGLAVPEGATKDEVSDLLSNRLERDKEADARHFGFADLYEVTYTRFTGKKSVYARIFAALVSPGRERDLAAWFLYRVYRSLVLNREGGAIAGPNAPILQKLAEELVTDESFIKSVRRYQGTDLISFGEWTAPSGTVHSGGSNQTIAYKRAAAALRDVLPSDVRKAPIRAPVSTAPPQIEAPRPPAPTEASTRQQVPSETSAQPTQRRGGCLPMLGLIACGMVVLAGVVVWVARLVV